MADVAIHGHHRYSDSISGMASTVPFVSTAPEIHMMPNPEFSFPRVPPPIPQDGPMNFQGAAHRRPKSMHLSSSELKSQVSHRRGASALPSFSFNAGDASGLNEETTELAPPLPPPTTPSRSNHKRQSSTFVGGHGVAEAISSSPTRSDALAIPRRRHGRNNSRQSLSAQDWSKVLDGPGQHQPRLSTSLPSSPFEFPVPGRTEPTDYAFNNPQQLPATPPMESPTDDLARPPSRPRVEFSDNVEYIPRPLSTISSETGSTMSTVRGHSVNNSISSVLSMNAPSPPSSRARAISLETTIEDEPRAAPRSSIEISKRIEKEGQWLRGGSSRESLTRPNTEPVPNSQRLTFSTMEPHKKPSSHKRRQSIGHALGFDRRRSEPAIGNCADEPSRLSALSLQEPATEREGLDAENHSSPDSRSSSRRIKDWAKSMVTRKTRPHSVYLATPEHPQAADASPVSEPAVAETDLDAVFSLDADDLPSTNVRARSTVPLDTSARHTWSSSRYPDNDDFGTMLDLDAALGPFQTPTSGMQKPRRELHSSRGTRDFGGPGGHYQRNPNHRRTESAPMLTPFDYSRTSTPPQAAMADVFEEEEEEDDLAARNMRANAHMLAAEDEAGTGVEIVDSDVSAYSSTSVLSLEDGLRIQNSQWEPERPSTAYSNVGSRLSASLLDRRGSVMEDTIVEEASPTEPAIVESYEEPRAQSLTKSSDSSETPTILAAPSGLLALPDAQHSVMTPDTYNSSAFSSPDFARRQSSFETSRVGTSASSITDNRTMSSCTTGEPMQDVRVSVDDVPSLTSSRSTMMSTMHANTSRRDMAGLRTPSITSSSLEAMASERRRKRGSIQSLSQLMGGSFSARPGGSDGSRPQTASDALANKAPKKKEHNRLKKLMFWKSKNRQASSSTIS